MSGYRVIAGYGQLKRSDSDLRDISQIPSQYNSVTECLADLNHRFGAGVDLSINRNRNNNYLQDIGMREFTSATSGMYELDFSVNGAFVPEMSAWLEYAVMSDPIVIKNGSTFRALSNDASKGYVINPIPFDEVETMPTTGYEVGQYVKYTGATTVEDPIYTHNHFYVASIVTQSSITWSDEGTDQPTTQSTSIISLVDFNTYEKKTRQQATVSYMPTTGKDVGDVVKYTGTTTSDYTSNHYYRLTAESPSYEWSDIGIEYNGANMEFHVYAYMNMDGPRYFDLGYVQVNENTTNGGLNEAGVLLGCIIESVSLNYESGSDAQVKFSINAQAMNEEILVTSDIPEYTLDYQPPLQPLVAGCVSVYDQTLGEYVPIAQTDSAGITINNNLTKLGNCLKLTYSSATLGAQVIEMNLSTYSNNPNKVLTYMYGYTQMDDGLTYTIAKQPKAISKMKIRSDNSSSIMAEGTQVLDMNLSDVYVGSANRTYNVDNALMDEPDLRVRRASIVAGYLTPQ